MPDLYNSIIAASVTGDGGTEVIANPTLSGTESDLTGIEVDGTKYSVGGGKQLYQHNIWLSAYYTRLMFQVITDQSSAITSSTLLSYLCNNGHIGVTTCLPIMYGTYTNNGTTYDIRGIYGMSGSVDFYGVVIDSGSAGARTIGSVSDFSSSITDTVVTL